ncbi:MAG: Glycosyltransferase [Candidatus Magasanikbacteria bacterium GW2011_GWC2_41_17]|uniref:Glycosyltransferase n=2 Tax=Candidatus Magasanikiibacteriota TaxID=1752731 RepID=A0A0G0YVH1_9BACT|nr:MAG: Glycosyltransferase [Candidatus Magasanikbacteria bacterium GW2011_GWC2_41_17]KKS13676.1 MAG: Glycosyltransferase [Candidatus Magasanikbacteria bacterium GW2011_GWA2_41_55]
MKVLITSGIFPPDIGGPARIIEQMAHDLQARGIDITVLAFGRDDNEKRNYQVIKALTKLRFLLTLFNLAKQVDIIYTFDLYTAGFLSWLIGKVFFNKKLVVRFAGDSAWEIAANAGLTSDDILSFQNGSYGLKIFFLKKLRTKILCGADKVVVVSNFIKNLAMQIGVDKEKIQVIYNAIDFLSTSTGNVAKIRQKFGLTDINKLIVTAGRLAPWKGFDGLINVLADTRQEFPSLKLLIIGDGPDKRRLETLRDKHNLGHAVVFVGRVPLDKIFEYYQAADVFVLNSQYEGLSHVLLEVLQFGKPIVASNCGGNPEVIENKKNGLLVEYNNREQIKAAIRNILSESYWQSNDFQDACTQSLKKFVWRDVIEKTANVLKEINQHG